MSTEIELTPLQKAYNDGIEAAKDVIRGENFGLRDPDRYITACLINAIARKTNPYAYKPVEEAPLRDVCVVCKVEPVCPEEGYDTCSDCARKI